MCSLVAQSAAVVYRGLRLEQPYAPGMPRPVVLTTPSRILGQSLGSQADPSGDIARENGGARDMPPTICLVTRMIFPRWFDVVQVFVAFRRMRRAASSVPGFVGASLTVLPSRTTVIVTLWARETTMAEFQSAVPEHVHRVRWTRARKAAVWSAMYELVGQSRTSSSWSEGGRR